MEKHSKYKIVDTIKTRTRPLKSVLDEYLPKGETIDFMSIDTEGHDLHVLKSNDWKKYRPKILLVEENNSDIEKVMRGDTYNYVVRNDYTLFSKTFNTLVFVEKREE